jgi:hypothetical protein
MEQFFAFGIPVVMTETLIKDDARFKKNSPKNDPDLSRMRGELAELRKVGELLSNSEKSQQCSVNDSQNTSQSFSSQSLSSGMSMKSQTSRSQNQRQIFKILSPVQFAKEYFFAVLPRTEQCKDGNLNRLILNEMEIL